MSAERDEAREIAFAAMHESGMTLGDIGQLVGLSRERVRQLCNRVQEPDGRRGLANYSITAVMRAVRDSRYTTHKAIASAAGVQPHLVRSLLVRWNRWDAVERLLRMRRRARRHGTTGRYTMGCRCDDCRAAMSAYQRDWYRANRASA